MGRFEIPLGGPPQPCKIPNAVRNRLQKPGPKSVLLFDRHALFRPATHEIHGTKRNTGTWKVVARRRCSALRPFPPGNPMRIFRSSMLTLLLSAAPAAT